MPVRLKRWKSKGRSKPPNTPPSATQASASTAQPSQPNNSPVHASAAGPAPNNPFRDKDQLTHDALKGLAEKDRDFVEKQLGSDSYFDRDKAKVEALRRQNETGRPPKWIVSMRKIACQIVQFAPVVDVATNVKPEVLSLPWAGIRFLLAVTQKTQEQSESILKGIETVLDTGHLLNAYFDIYGQLDATPAIRPLYDNIVKLYGLNLTFVAHAQHTCDMKSFKRTIHSLTGQVIPKFEKEHDRILATVEFHRQAVNDEVSKEQRAFVQEQLKELKKAQEEVNERVKGVQQALDLSALQYAKKAAYDSVHYTGDNQDGDFQLCLDGTRVDIIETIRDWATTDNEQRVFWLSGKAGTGKSTIARTVAHKLAEQGYLVGSFFFKRGVGEELSNAQYLFPTIAHHMAYFIPSISDKIADASRNSPDAVSKPLEKQFEMLIEGPLLGYDTGSATDVRAIVIDALDECDARRAIGQAMKLWLRLSAHTSMNLRIFVTSRSDNAMLDTLGQLDPKHFRSKRLEDWQSSTIEDDLRLFCNDGLRKLREQNWNESNYDELEDDWPGELVVNKLVEISKPLFIAASTILRDVMDEIDDPQQKLQEWVDRVNFAGMAALDEIYLGVLEQAVKHHKGSLGWFSQVIKPFALLHSSLTISAFKDLLGETTRTVTNALKPLSSVIEFPSGKEFKAGSRATVRIYHESFREFLKNSSPKDHPKFWIDQGEVHGVLISKCLNLLKNKLGRDVCKQKDPATERKGVSAEDVEKHIPESVQYACRYWISHAVESKKTLEDGGQVDRFLRASFLHWTEAMAWLDKLGEMIICLKQLQKAIDYTESMPNRAQSKSSPKLHAFVADALRWVPANRNLISDTPLQTYLSALAFAPSNSVVRNTFRSDMEEFLQVWAPVATDWGFELQTLRGHTNHILSITPSIDGRRLVTVAVDNTVRLWDVESGTEEKRTEIDLRKVKRSLRIDLRAASAFPKEDIVVIAELTGGYWRWNLEDDARPIDIKLPSVEESDEENDEEMVKFFAIDVAKSAALSVSVSPNGRYAAWGLRNGGIYIWDADNNAGQVVEGHNSPVRCLHFSSDSETLVSGSTDIWKWSPQAGPEKLCQVGTDIDCIAISPNRKFVVFWSVDDTISVFHCTTDQVEQIMRMKNSYNKCLMVTPDSQKVLFGDGDSLYLYDFQTQQEPMKLRLGDIVTAMTLSPDGKAIWAGYWSGQSTQLDVDLLLKSPQHRTGPATLALSTDGRSLASLTKDNQLSVWNIETQICERRLTDDRLAKISYTKILISPDSRFVVVASLSLPPKNVVLICDMDADELRELKDRPGHATALALSADNKTLLCGLRDGQIWAIDLERGLLREKFPGHTREISAIAISPDGQNFASASYDKTVRIWGPKSQTPLVLSSELAMKEACFSADGRMLYTHDSKDCISEWDIEKACIVRTLDRGPLYGSILIDGRFVPSRFLPVVDRLAANEDNQPQTQADSSAATRSTSIFQGRQICALDNTYEWITVNGRKMFKRHGKLRAYGRFSCGRTMVIPNFETGFTVLYLTGKVPF
ncbi:tricorn protease domain 2-containing protein [Piedraia hortae CBS 480.64]|uniref:Tricorn protease domain 2-containing protein n=1 Tax=Piedraia hortae CBS 480.64 TaxID=1314780 RepID=A0A6A7C3A0_9PEZI|nr:tricorn protease domain 2-containing protein [Piedraia hortae CBS 480.64]